MKQLLSILFIAFAVTAFGSEWVFTLSGDDGENHSKSATLANGILKSGTDGIMSIVPMNLSLFNNDAGFIMSTGTSARSLTSGSAAVSGTVAGGYVNSIGGATGAIALGSGITITGGTMSATGQSYSAGSNITISSGTISLSGTVNGVTLNSPILTGTSSGIITRTGTFIGGTYQNPRITGTNQATVRSDLGITATGDSLVTAASAGAARAAIGVPDVRFVMTPEITTANTTLVSSTQAAISISGTGYYVIEVLAGVGSSDAASAGSKIGLTYTGTCSGEGIVQLYTAGGNTNGWQQFGSPTAVFTSGTFSRVSGSATQTAWGSAVLNVSSSGTLALQFAQCASTSGTASLRPGSYIRVTKTQP